MTEPADHDGPWVARFLDGPCESWERHWSVGPIWRELRLTKTTWGWGIVGGDGIPTDTEVVPWDDEVTYVLDSTLTPAPTAYREVIGFYRLA
jgi:hypothetical protein